jgi:hypothetical protein
MVRQVSVSITLRNEVAHLLLRALGSHFVTSYDSQGYGGGILTRLHTGFCKNRIENTVSYCFITNPSLGVRRVSQNEYYPITAFLNKTITYTIATGYICFYFLSE